ncbi:ABC transporter permease [Nafulsella turpanensis]|uniref:ABC transporter permease n=1 Tax=Nafulsella turpanensis TaxID=1265690 RepID=UPI000349C55C|nr:ABC transporter permease [Nafulsella turpanensis]
MNMLTSFRSELLKSKRTASLYVCLFAAAIIPLLLVFDTATPQAIEALSADPWNLHFKAGIEFMGTLILPMFIILICTLLPQIEYRNNTWKQLMSSPQPFAHIFFSKFLTVHLLVLLFFTAYNLLMLLSALVVNYRITAIEFFDHSIDWHQLIVANFRTYSACLAIISIQFWAGMRFKNAVTPIAIGFGLWILAAVLVIEVKWEHVDKFPFAYPILMIYSKYSAVISLILWKSIAYAVFFSGLAYLDFRLRKVKAA